MHHVLILLVLEITVRDESSVTRLRMKNSNKIIFNLVKRTAVFFYIFIMQTIFITVVIVITTVLFPVSEYC